MPRRYAVDMEIERSKIECASQDFPFSQNMLNGCTPRLNDVQDGMSMTARKCLYFVDEFFRDFLRFF
jgi:hypothetical protein